MKNMMKVFVAAVALLGLVGAAQANPTCIVTAVPSNGGGVFVTKSLTNVPDDEDYKSTDSSTYGLNTGKAFRGFAKEISGTSEFLKWTESADGSGEALSTSTDELFWLSESQTRTIYAHFHVHAKVYLVNGLTIDYKCTNDTTTCKNSCGSSSATLVAADSKPYDGAPYAASVEGDQTAQIAFYSGDEKLASAPTEQGTYTVKMTYGDKTVEKSVTITHAHAWTQNVPTADGKTTWTCGRPDCPSGTPSVKLVVSDKDFDATAVAFGVEKSEGFDTLVPGVTIGAVEYCQGGSVLGAAPKAAGDYVAKVAVGNYTLQLDFTIRPASMSDITALPGDPVDYTAAEQEVTLKSVLFGQYGLTADDYELTGDTTAIGSGYGDVTNKVTLVGKGNFTGAKEIEWIIKAPTGSFAGCEKSDAAIGGILEGTTLTLTNGCDYVYADGQWQAGLKGTYPVASLEFTQPTRAVFTVTGETFTAADAPKNGVTCEKKKSLYTYVESFTYTAGFTAAQLDAVAAADLVRSVTACALVWKGTGVGDPDGIRATDFSVVAKTAGLVLPLPADATHDLGAAKLANIRICLAAGATVTTTVLQDAGRIFTDVPGHAVKYTEDAGVYTYAVVLHDHEWAWTLSGDGSVLTAACTVAGCNCQLTPMTVGIGPKTVSSKYCDQIPLEATIVDGEAFTLVTGATIGEIAYRPELTGQPGSYSAFAEVVSAEGDVTNVLTTSFAILTGQAITNGIHVADMAEYLELKTQEDMMILVATNFTASKQYVVPASWKAETLPEIELTIRQFIEAVKNGTFGNLITWDDVRDLLAGRLTAKELAQRLAEAGKQITLLDCGVKTLDLNGFTVTASKCQPLLCNQGQLVITGEGTLRANGRRTLIVNEGTLAIESGTYVGAITNAGTLVVSGGYFTGPIVSGAGTVVLTGGTYELKPNKDFIPSGYDLVRRDGLYTVEKHVHDYTFLPLGKSLLSCTCWNWFVEDPDQLIQFSNCGAHKVGVFIATKDAKTGVLPARVFAETGKPVEATIVGYNFSELARIGMLCNVQELVDIAQAAIDAEENWDEMDALTKVKTMMNVLASIKDLDIDLKNFVWDQAKVAEETGLIFGDVKYYDATTDEELIGAPSTAGLYRARVVITTAQGDEVTRSWKFAIGTEYKSDFKEWTDETDLEIVAAHEKMVEDLKTAHAAAVKWANKIFGNLEEKTVEESAPAPMMMMSLAAVEEEELSGWEKFKAEIKETLGRLPTEEEVEAFFAEEGGRHAQFVAWLEQKGVEIHGDLVTAHDQMVRDLKAQHALLVTQTKAAVQEIEAIYARHEETYVDEAHDVLKKAWSNFCDEVEREWNRSPKKDEIENFFEEIDNRISDWVEERRQSHAPVDQEIINAHTAMVNQLRAFDTKVAELGTNGVSKVMAWVERHHIAEADLADAVRGQFAQASMALDRALIQLTNTVKIASMRTEEGDLVISVTIDGETVKSANITDMIETTHDLAKQEWKKIKDAAIAAEIVTVDPDTGKITIKPIEDLKSFFVRVNIPADK